MHQSPNVLIFDVNETLLDLAGLDPLLVETFGSPPPRGEWFARLLHSSIVANYTNRYRPFGEIGVEVLLALAERRQVDLTEEQARRIVGTMLSLPPHPEVPEAMRRLAAAGYRLATLTNNATAAVAAQMRNAGLDGYLEVMISVDEVGLFKPAPEVYQKAAERLDIEMEQGLLIAAHDWDVVGARAAGMPGAFLARPGSVWGLPDDKPDLAVSDLAALADRLIV
ncbi:MAG: haloacid dehalogenase type II [Acidimicrobiia bacterium]